MEYTRLALSLSWPQMVVAILWFAAGLAALWYARATRRPIFLFSSIAAFILSGSAILSPARLAYRYLTNQVFCPSVDTCTIELRFGGAKYEWLMEAIAALVLVAGFYLEVARARRRAAANNAARAAASRAAANKAAASARPTGGIAPSGGFAGQYHPGPGAQPNSRYGAAVPGGVDPAPARDHTQPAEDGQATLYGKPTSGSGPV